MLNTHTVILLFQNLFESIAKNDVKKGEIYREILQKDIVKERQAYHTIREELLVARRRNQEVNNKLLYENGAIAKREIENFTSNVKRFDVGDMSPSNYLYIQIKDNMPEMSYPTETEETKDMKEDICIGIMKSEWMVHKRNLDIMKQHGQALYKELQENYPDIYAEYSSKVGRANHYRLQNITAYNDESLEHEIEEMETFDLQEYVFSCLARNRISGKIEQYFISQEYNLEKCKMKRLLAVFIRFIFTFVERRGIIPVAFTDDRLENYRLEPDK